jgi:hypothetical protein
MEMNKAERKMAESLFRFIEGNFREELTEAGFKVSDVKDREFLVTVSEIDATPRSCTGCDAFSICTVREAAESLQRPLSLVSGGFINLYEFVGSKCRHYKDG